MRSSENSGIEKGAFRNLGPIFRDTVNNVRCTWCSVKESVGTDIQDLFHPLSFVAWIEDIQTHGLSFSNFHEV